MVVATAVGEEEISNATTIRNVPVVLLPTRHSRACQRRERSHSFSCAVVSGIDAIRSTPPTIENTLLELETDSSVSVVAAATLEPASHERDRTVSWEERLHESTTSRERSLHSLTIPPLPYPANIMGYSNNSSQQQQQSHYPSSSWPDQSGTASGIGHATGRSLGLAGSSSDWVDDEKTMDLSTVTALTQLTHIGGGESSNRDIEGFDDDDTTTIRSIDSITGAGLLSLTEDYDQPRNDLLSVGIGNPSILESSSLPNSHGREAAAASAGGVASSVCSVSTAPSTDEASSIGHHDWTEPGARLLHLQQQQAHHHQQQQQYHRRVPSWEASPNHHHASTLTGGRGSPSSINLPPTFSPSAGWPSLGQQQQHVASFRAEHPPNQSYQQSGRLSANAGQWFQSSSPSSTINRGLNEPTSSFVPPSNSRGGQDHSRGMSQRPSSNPYPFHPLSQHQQQQPHQHHHQQQLRKPYGQPLLPPSANTPPRGALNDRGGRLIPRISVVAANQTPHRLHQSQPSTPTGGGGPRSSSEVLKTLLRKKACLYEPDTSRAVALVTWLVGRELALEYGFFSRQQLQAGVHACVSTKINSGIITRTKVNRCMQIILNSCFHYIIPRPDGTEENGEAYRGVFSKEMKDNTFLLSVLPLPWNDLGINRCEILAACEEEELEHKSLKKFTFETPHASPRLGSVSEKSDRVPSSPSRDSIDGDSEKRAVLLCFNENVRSAEDVFRCHNEFIRDTAHACHLQLSSSEWRQFFGHEAANAPYLWGNVGIPVPFLEGQGPKQTDALGVITSEELGVFRTNWCSKRYDHDHELCGFGHAEVNGGWLRRNPFIHSYGDELCHFVSTTPTGNRTTSRAVIMINECPDGVNCTFAHSHEEVTYHGRRYKQRTCASISRAGGCPLGDVCFGFHPVESYRFPKKSDSRSPRHGRSGQQHANSGGKSTGIGVHPTGSPILYSSPAPMSNFEHHMILPGLQTLYRRNCTVSRASLQSSVRSAMVYSCFEPTLKQPPIADQSHPIGPPQQLRI